MHSIQKPEIQKPETQIQENPGPSERSRNQDAPELPAGPERLASQAAVRVAAIKAPAPAPDGPTGLLLRSYLRGQFVAMLHEDPRVRANEADAVHKMRVSTRRMRSALASYRAVLAEEPARELRGELKWLASILGEARDAQVMRARLSALLAEQPAGLVLGPVQQRIDEELLGDYRAAYAVIREVLDGGRYERLLQSLERVVTGPAFTAEARMPAAESAGEMLRRDRKRLHRRVRQAREASSEDQRAEALHEARKEAKRLRYAAEVAQPVRPEGAGELIAGAEHVQKILGEHQDSVVSLAYLRRLGASASDAGQNGFTYGRLHALEEQHGKVARKRFRKAWAGFPRVV
ncbi:CHAD domain-containing protein [Arthrobacter sp. zg-ZUI100]|uniref:CHAD domain-containing protein n=1 Tax=Arthrobacter jiangjiafuii TaxID=2817475 RepID=UPI001AEE47A8|nr:CHAD domain-containing protein [Arthrobacter jiangjiafuii]MBP3037789.1 CHAD domain-containing protein [Arthrobacter jiangjiafuii]